MVFIKRKIDNKLGRGVAGGGGERSRGGPEGGVSPWGRAASRPAGRSSPGGEEGVRRGGGRPAGRSSTCKGKENQMAATRESSALFTPRGRLGAQSRGKARALDRGRQNFRGPRARPPTRRLARFSADSTPPNAAYAPPSSAQRRDARLPP